MKLNKATEGTKGHRCAPRDRGLILDKATEDRKQTVEELTIWWLLLAVMIALAIIINLIK